MMCSCGGRYDHLMRVLLVEDEPNAALVLARGLREQAYAVDVAVDGEAALFQAATTDYDAVVLDVMLPVTDGFAVCRSIRASGCPVPILMVTARDAVEARIEGLDCGADDYLVKPFDFDELHARLRALLRIHGAPSTQIGEWELLPARNAIESPYEGRVALTPRETALLELLAAEPERAFSRSTILRRVFDPDAGPGTVDTYVHAIRRKTERDLIETVRGRGYRIGLR
jgi:two-component system, OmpR family, response regulator QseB